MGDKENPFSDSYIAEAEAFECSGIVLEAHRAPKKSAKTGEEQEYLFLTIKPTNYEGKDLVRQYRVDKSRNGKFIPFVKAAKKVMAEAGLPFNSEQDLVGHEMRWRVVEVTRFEGDDGNEVVVNPLVPIKYIGKAGAEAAAPAQEHKAPQVVNSAPMDEKVLGLLKVLGSAKRTQIVDSLKANPMDVIKALGNLQTAGKVKVVGDDYMPI